MEKAWQYLDNYFDKLSVTATRIFGHWLVFIMALGIIAYWMLGRDWHTTTAVDAIRDFILCVTFLSFFIIQKSFSRFSKALQLKLDELVATQEKARNDLIKAEDKTEAELTEMSKEHEKLLKQKGNEKRS